jgi:starch phosphorylase
LVGSPWLFVNYLVSWGGYTEHQADDAGRDRVHWVPGRLINGVAYDTPIQGFGQCADPVERASR